MFMAQKKSQKESQEFQEHWPALSSVTKSTISFSNQELKWQHNLSQIIWRYSATSLIAHCQSPGNQRSWTMRTLMAEPRTSPIPRTPTCQNVTNTQTPGHCFRIFWESTWPWLWNCSPWCSLQFAALPSSPWSSPPPSPHWNRKLKSSGHKRLPHLVRIPVEMLKTSMRTM